MKKITVACHDCGLESTVLDKFDELDIDDIKHCLYCGSDNIEKE